MKKFLQLVSLVLVAVVVFVATPVGKGAKVSAAVSGDFEYTVNDGSATIKKYLGIGGNVTIPDTLGGYKVTEIGNSAFSNCGERLTSVIIPDGVTTIGWSAFEGCKGLTDINIPDSVVTIGGYAFCGCESLKDITIPNSVTTISNFAFAGCSNLKSVVIPNKLPLLKGTFLLGVVVCLM
ncbi:MAG: leucine-rich repeat domain-containing protein [Oscillospiraceae bacterium]|nr:leucine-rich repeat domain-containing protein [Oscillospiraceae bacterium]